MSEVLGVVCALAPELGGLASRARARRKAGGMELLEIALDGGRALAVVAGVGKVAAAGAAARLAAEGVRAVVVVGTCAGLSPGLVPGTLVHCASAFQVDLAVREGRSQDAHPGLLATWRALVPGPSARFLTADRPVGGGWGRRRLVRAFPGPCVADMETAAVAAVAARAGLPWGALKAVTDDGGRGAREGFRRNFEREAGRAADTVNRLVSGLGAWTAVEEGG